MEYLSTRAFGFSQEQIALTYLTKQRLTLIEQNFQCRFGEIDLIMHDPDNTIIFIEVRSRNINNTTGQNYGGAATSVNIYKQQKIIKSARCYLHMKQLTHQAYSRFDVIAIERNQHGNHINWIKGAFTTT